MLPENYQWLANEPGPRILREFLAVYGTRETPGPGNNPSIMQWADAIGLSSAYTADSIPWCGLAMGYVAGQAGWDFAPNGNALWARNWLHWGTPQEIAMLGDVLVFSRQSGGHVGIYVGEDTLAFHVLGGNQSDQVNIKRIRRNKLLGARRCPWRINQPANVRRIFLDQSGDISDDDGLFA